MASEKDVELMNKKLQKVVSEVGNVVIGQSEVIKQVIISILCDGNALLEGNPGVGKTTMVKSLSDAMDLKFARIQGTPDLMPSDITGTYIIEDKAGGKKGFSFQKGPIFANVILFDEINRTTPRTQAALLEAMQERQVTLGNKSFNLDRPFFVLATQNPIDMEGTFSLPEAQTDRFLLKINVDYPLPEEELAILERFASQAPVKGIEKQIDSKSIESLQNLVKEVPIASDLKQKIIDLVAQTRKHKYVQFGASPRATIALTLTAKANALLEGRTYVSEKDITEMAIPVLRHRIILNFEAEKENLTTDEVIKEMLGKDKKK